MKKVLVTGATGVLGRRVVSWLGASGYEVRIMSRRPPTRLVPEGVEWFAADLATGDGVAETVRGIEVIIHAASSPLFNTQRVDVAGTERLLRAAEGAGVEHIIYPSIVGIDEIPYPYYRRKLEVESLLQTSGLPYTILRAAQFYSFMDSLLRTGANLPVLLVPRGVRLQPLEADEMAKRLTRLAGAEAQAFAPDLVGPEILTFDALARLWLRVQGSRRPVLPLPIRGQVAAGFRAGQNLNPEAERVGITWLTWLRRVYAKEREMVF